MFEDSDGKASELPVVWADAEKILSAVSEERNFIGKVFVKAMADGGQGFLKICLTILPEDFDNDATDSDDSKGEPSKRSTYEEGDGIGTYKLTSVKRVIMLAIVPDCKETHKNMKTLFDLTQLNRISFLFVADFKLLLICLGCQTATSTKPCPYCLISLKQLTPDYDNEDPPVDFVETSIEKFEERTFGNLQESHTKFVNEYASNKKKAKFCNSTINAPHFDETSEVRVLDKCPPEELHMMQGFVNHTFFKGLVEVIGEEKALNFPKSLNCVAKDYHGTVFEGNACRMMLKNADRMQDRKVLGDTSPLIVLPYVKAYKAMDKLVSSCFGNKFVDTDEALDLIEKVMSSYLDLNITVTLKIHVIFCHLLSSLQNPALNGRGLAKVSGQAGESIHHEFKIFWGKYKINSLDNKLYGEHLLKAVIEFSSKHL